MASAAEPGFDELMWTAAVARLVFGPRMNIQVPPNLSYDQFANPVGRRHQRLGRRFAGDAGPCQSGSTLAGPASARARDRRGRLHLVERLAVYPGYVARCRTLDCTKIADAGAAASRMPRALRARTTGRRDLSTCPIPAAKRTERVRRDYGRAADRAASAGEPAVGARDRLRCFPLVAATSIAICAAADGSRQRTAATWYATSSIATSTTPMSALQVRLLRVLEGQDSASSCAARPTISRSRRWRAACTRSLGARRHRSLHAGRHQSALYRRDLSRAAAGGEGGSAGDACPCLLAAGGIRKARRRSAFRCRAFLERLRDAGLGSLPGTAAEILDDEVRAIICPDKLEHRRMAGGGRRRRMRSACATTATIMFGHVERPVHWARHLLALPRSAGTHRRVHRIRATAVRPHGSAARMPAGGPARDRLGAK